MGVSLIDGPDMSWAAWHYCLQTAVEFGWRPAGTEIDFCPYSGEKLSEEARRAWKGSYFYNGFQFVTDTDAKALSKALNAAIAAIEADPSSGARERHNIWLLRMLALYAGLGEFQIC